MVSGEDAPVANAEWRRQRRERLFDPVTRT